MPSAGDWGTASAPSPTPPLATPTPPLAPPPALVSRAGLEPPKPELPPPPPAAIRPADAGPSAPSPQVLATKWRRVRRGLFCVQFGIFCLALMGLVGFGKMVYERTQGPLPKLTDRGWIVIEGYVNTEDKDAIQTTKGEELDLFTYGIPVFLATLSFGLGRLICSGAPRLTGASGLFAISALCVLLAFPALATAFMLNFIENTYDVRFTYTYFHKLPDNERYAWTVFFITAILGELLFLVGLAACGIAVNRPRAVRSIGALLVLWGVFAFIMLAGWDLYKTEFRQPNLNDDLRLYEQAALMIGWLIMAGVYWRAVRAVRAGAREYIDSVATT